ncbi:PREDICTED: L-type lectin-domain containing receptor kinase VII.1-like [Camelina sativa]|uniref:L-type lectin-domain containing receptor kinase VII.1-like n=1 Tax=Camelina sativa TaxID=90675 RepID=A0ABM0TV80_CAMSA|nr:PREDICTED: L-type lectin-domain containing receptor kinase VII.1-like [Camelina sativa]
MEALLFLLTLLELILLSSVSAVDFVFNGFNDSSSVISLFGIATIESKILTLTNQTSFETGRALYSKIIRTKDPVTSSVLPFSTSFIFAMAPYKNTLPGHGIVFLFAPTTGINGSSSAQHLGLFNLTNNGNPSNHIFGVEFDVFANQEFSDIDANHVGIDVNSLHSMYANTSGYWSDDGVFKPLKLNDGRNYQVWIDYRDFVVNVTMQVAGKIRPKAPLLSTPLNLSGVVEDEMFVGFTAATGRLVQSHKILAWSFSNSNFSLSDSLVTSGLPSFVLPKDSILKAKWFVSVLALFCFLIVSLFGLVLFGVVRKRLEKARKRALMEDWEMEYWPHRIPYEEIESGTKGFDEKNVIGIGGNGKVYKGLLQGGVVEVAVKRISQESSDGMREFVAEISSLGRLKHRNLVSLTGWCKKEKGSFMLVYDYMENGSLDRWIFENDDKKTILSCEERIRILKGVASGILYLHEGWESKVLHRDIKASNVLLDRDMIPRLSDFGLARVHGHEQAVRTTRVVGTAGYLSPEVVKTGRASTQTDVFAYGILVLEVMCGRRPIEEGKKPLMDWVWGLMEKGEILNGLDPRMMMTEALNHAIDEAERVLQLGLLCAHPDPAKRPSMRQVVQVFEGDKAEIFEAESSEDVESWMLRKMGSRGSSREFWYGSSSHPTMEQIRLQSLSVSISSWNSSILDGR